MNSERIAPDDKSRRDFLKATGAGAVALTLVPQSAEASPESVMAEIKKITGGKTPADGKVKIILPEIAENGGTVPVTVSVDSPMSSDNYVKGLHIFADGNPLPDVAQYYFGPHNGKAQVAIRARLAKTQSIVAMAEMSNGEIYMSGAKIKVTIGGCGG